MAMIPTMDEKKAKPKASSLRVDPLLKQRFKAFCVSLQMPGGRLGDDPPMEQVAEALWLWFTRLGPDGAQKFLARELPLVEAFKGKPRTEPPAPELNFTIENVTRPTKKPKRSGA